MPAATILFTDIVGFSKKPTAEQRRLVNALTAEVIHELRPLLIPPLHTPSILAMPTGDGMAIAFLHNSNQAWDHSAILRLILRLHKWAWGETTNHSPVSLRVGVHVGPVELITDINGRPNICGDTINFTQRVMDAANPRQMLYSDTAFREYIGTESPICVAPPFSKDLKGEFQGPIEVYAKHGLQILVYKLTLQPVQEWWFNDDPVAKHLMLVSLTPLPKEVVGTFSEKLGGATQIAFIQLTGDRFLASFEEGRIKFSAGLKRFWIFMPDPETYGQLHLLAPHASPQFVNECIAKWKEFFAKMKVQYEMADLKLGLFKEPPYFGASFIDWERPGGRIHVSPYVWSIPAPNCPGYDLEWIGKKPSPIYEVYVNGLRYLHSQTIDAAFQQ